MAYIDVNVNGAREVIGMKIQVDSQTYKVAEAAKLLGIGLAGAYKAIENGDLPAIKLGKRFVIAKSTIDKMLRIEGKAV
jgi:excisionase family DNA binding protein